MLTNPLSKDGSGAKRSEQYSGVYDVLSAKKY